MAIAFSLQRRAEIKAQKQQSDAAAARPAKRLRIEGAASSALVAAPASTQSGGVMNAAVFQAQIAGMQTLLQQMQAQMAQMPAVITPPLLTPTGSSTSSNGSSSFLPPGQAPLPPPVPAMPLAENGAGLTQPTLQPHGSGTANGQPQSVQQQAGTGDYDGGNGGDGIGGGDGGIGGVFLGDDAAGTGANDPLLMMNGADGAGDGNAGDGGAGVNDLSAGPGLDDDGEWCDSQEAFDSFLGDILSSDE